MFLSGITGEAKKSAREGRSRPVWDREKCTLCGGCVPVCDADAITVFETFLEIDEKRCRLCGDCVLGCPTGALEIQGAGSRVQGAGTESGSRFQGAGTESGFRGQGSGTKKKRIGGGRG